MTKVLLVEDHTEIRQILPRELERLDFTAITAENGKKAVEAAVNEKPDLTPWTLCCRE